MVRPSFLCFQYYPKYEFRSDFDLFHLSKLKSKNHLNVFNNIDWTKTADHILDHVRVPGLGEFCVYCFNNHTCEIGRRLNVSNKFEGYIKFVLLLPCFVGHLVHPYIPTWYISRLSISIIGIFKYISLTLGISRYSTAPFGY